MAERGAEPKVSLLRRTALRAVRLLFNPLRPDDYLSLINPLWTTRELRGQVVRIAPEGSDAVSVYIRPGFEWTGHIPGQYVRLGVLIDGRYHWRAYSLTSDPDPVDGLVSVSPKLVPDGTVSPYLVGTIRTGDIVRLSEVEGEFTLPDPLPDKMVFISAGSGITPIISMLRSLDHQDRISDVVVVHSVHSREQLMFADTLEELDARHDGLRLELRITSDEGRMKASELDQLVPDWREREAFCSGPGEHLEDLRSYWKEQGDPDRFHHESFQPVIGGDAGDGEGGTVRFLNSDKEVECDGGTTILAAGENAGLDLTFGCRIGICHTCVGTLKSGRLRDLRNGEVSEPTGQAVRICVNTAEGDIAIEL
ncbi:ferredoxin reductase [Rhodococcus sp. BP-252]|uniref:Stearoyl-CoA 9-desaturase n=1 Tax=Rhodococcoides kyotonense TaxID=398843 RepID=A0A177YMV6_9NOCA|nr:MULTISPECIES: ferredoxin reductase [Rhodococcus]NIL77433.1 NADPH oxidoreductase [Rhodococcus sp. B10]MBY6414889.1 ferredoxin reductase [Rhodococcus sp. BP-320]MBY6419853.1 ferredoxin reductase [Rhodococcus sp. BP-321]MBY6424825.1 ferredoxin reductase [Rhodococcus sp. BP-324]MBY6429785.1 ferredoxin reductase [Rhodococcus sp. BP-323]